MSRAKMRELSRLSPFELKDTLLALAGENQRANAVDMLNAGVGNPNWIATTPREAFFTLGQFALGESRRLLAGDDIGGAPERSGIAHRFNRFIEAYPGLPGADLLRRAVEYGVLKLGFDPDTWMHELTDGVLGDHYPAPNRMLRCAERVVRAYLAREVYDGCPPAGDLQLFATEGGTAAMCAIFDSLTVNRVLHPGDRIALMVPVFTPYLEIPQLDRYHFDTVPIVAGQTTEQGVHTWHYAPSEVDKLRDPSVKALFLVNPSNPPSQALPAEIRAQIVDIVARDNPNLIIITDDVYATFVQGFRSLAADLPHNTLLVYSYSKHYGATGWRLGVIGVHEDNVVDHMIATLPEDDRAALTHRYRSLALEPAKVRFIDRLVADSRQVALNHTAGLSLPQQVQMVLFSLFDLLDEGQRYKLRLRQVVRNRLNLLLDGSEQQVHLDADSACYYVELDLMAWARRVHGEEFVRYLTANYEPVDVVFRLAQRTSVVLLSGAGFGGPDWSVRVSLANLDDIDYLRIGYHLRAISEEYVQEWRGNR